MMIKNLFLLALLFAFAQSFANNNNWKVENTTSQIERNDKNESLEVFQCSVTASGTAKRSNGSVVNLTITVTGPCDSSLADKMRSAIAKARGVFAKM